MKFDINYTFSDFYEAQKLNYFSSNQKYTIFIVGAILLGITFSVQLGDWFYSVLFVGLLMLFYPFTFLLLNSYFSFKKAVNLHTLTKFIVDANLIVIKNKDGDSKINWSAFIKHESNSKVLIWYSTYQLFHFIPKRVLLEEEWKSLLTLSEQKIRK